MQKFCEVFLYNKYIIFNKAILADDLEKEKLW